MGYHDDDDDFDPMFDEPLPMNGCFAECNTIKNRGEVANSLKSVNGMDEDRPFDDKAEQFDRLWDGITPKGVNRAKAMKFRQYILEHVRQMR